MSPILETWANASVRGFGEFLPSGSVTYELISTQFGTGSSSTISFTSIPQTYAHLEVRGLFRGTTAAAPILGLRFNNAAGGTDYYSHKIFNSTQSTTNINNTYINLHPAAACSANTAGQLTPMAISILDYTSSNKYKNAYTQTNQPDMTNNYLSAGLNLVTTAITSLQILDAGGNPLTTDTRISLYGIKG